MSKTKMGINKIWLLWAVVLIIIGSTGIGGLWTYRNGEAREIALYQEKYSQTEDEYLALYDQWSQLKPDEKLKNPWGHGKYGGQELFEELQKHQKERLKAQMDDLASGVKQPHALSDILYGPDWSTAVAKYKQKKEIGDLVLYASIAAFLGGLLLILITSIRMIIGRKSQTKYPEEMTGNATKDTLKKAAKAEFEDDHYKKFVRASQHNHHENAEKAIDNTMVGYFEAVKYKKEKATTTKTDTKKTSETYSDKPKKTINASEYEGKFEPAAGINSVETMMSTTPVAVANDSLSELTQEMSAIREFAAQQQDRVKQLQEGYDWVIIKRFCMRIVRCVDNLESRISKFEKAGEETGYLQDVRDELVFALESSGVEQFEPGLEDDYKGLEKEVEAVRTRIKTNTASLKGKIAEIVRPGYKYVVNEDEVKVVRCAQVKLYG
jgi:hypothetical protein